MQTENTYVETDLGNIALNPRGEYLDEASYEYLDTVSYKGGSYTCLAELTKTISGIAPAQGKNTEHWQMLTLPGQLTPEAVAMHDDVVNKAKQVETSRAAVELSQQEVEAAQADVSQMRQDTQEASEEAAVSRDSAAGYAQSAEASRTAAKESEDNINAQITGFDTHVAEKTSATESTVEEARKKAIDAITTQQDTSTKAVTDEGTTQTNRVEGTGNTAVSAVAKQQAASVQAVENAGTAQVTAIESAGDEQITEVNKAGTVQVENVEEAAKQQNVNITEAAAQELIKLQEVAKQFAEDHEQIETNKEDISNKITKFYASNQGETHITDSDSGKIMDMMLYGKSEQKQYSGKNLLELSDNQVQSENLKIQINQGIITFSGTVNTMAFVREIDSFIVPSDGTYTISTNSNSNNDSPRILFLINDNPQYGSAFNGATKELNAGDVVRLYIRISSVGSYDGVTIKPMIEKGSKVTSYEPYTGGIPSPSPDYPQEIKSVVNPTVKVCGKNLWNPILGGYISNTDGSITANLKTSSAVTDFIKTSGKDITVIARNFSSAINNSYAYRIGFYDVRKKWIKNVIPLDGNKYSINTFHVTGTEYIRVSAPFGIYDTLQIKKGSEATPYEPCTEQSVQLPYTLNAIPVSSGGNVTINGQQYVADYVDVERGKVVRMCGRETFNTKNGVIDEEYRLAFGLHPAAHNDGNRECVFSAFKWTGWGTCVAGTKLYIKEIKKSNNELYTAQELKELSLDFDVVYQLLEQQETALTTEQTQALKELVTYYPVTNININSDQLDGYTVFNYPISMANGWNYVKQQLNDNRDYIYDMDTKTQDIDTQAAEAYVNSEYAVALTELEV